MIIFLSIFAIYFGAILYNIVDPYDNIYINQIAPMKKFIVEFEEDEEDEEYTIKPRSKSF